MNPYELVRPDGTGTGVWGCGNCHRVHLHARMGIRPDSGYNKLNAEHCCASHNCRYCGKSTERNELTGQWPWFHIECIPEPVRDPLHPSMADPFARLLYQKMSWLSEEGSSSGWETGNEYVLWNCLQNHYTNFGRHDLTDEDFEELRVLSQLAKGWIWTGTDHVFEPQLVSFETWEQILARDNRA
jgi:hypothetical protein